MVFENILVIVLCRFWTIQDSTALKKRIEFPEVALAT
jgi:hypothetical protein